MIKKTGKTPKSHIENIKNNECHLFLCESCDRLIRGLNIMPSKCPVCGKNKIFKCEINVINISDVDG